MNMLLGHFFTRYKSRRFFVFSCFI